MLLKLAPYGVIMGTEMHCGGFGGNCQLRAEYLITVITRFCLKRWFPETVWFYQDKFVSCWLKL